VSAQSSTPSCSSVVRGGLETHLFLSLTHTHNSRNSSTPVAPRRDGSSASPERSVGWIGGGLVVDGSPDPRPPPGWLTIRTVLCCPCLSELPVYVSYLITSTRSMGPKAISLTSLTSLSPLSLSLSLSLSLPPARLTESIHTHLSPPIPFVLFHPVPFCSDFRHHPSPFFFVPMTWSPLHNSSLYRTAIIIIYHHLSSPHLTSYPRHRMTLSLTPLPLCISLFFSVSPRPSWIKAHTLLSLDRVHDKPRRRGVDAVSSSAVSALAPR
jgi:hypothetical protein